ncbi:MAG TPA: Xaa-Pro peptidase family protein [Mycobacteriales bacterium]|nr:Xaa-Pro peptidase family protein [Mycobacteriales bacterium]
MNFADRLLRARAATAAAGLDALLVAPGPDLRYLTGYGARSSERLTCLVLPATGDPVLILPRLERSGALASPLGALGLELLDWSDGADPYGLVGKVLAAPGRVAVDDHMAAAFVLGLRAALPEAEQRLAGPVLGPLRTRKAPDEVAALRAAGAAIDRVHERMGEWLRPGRTERAVGRDIAEAILAEGHETADFTIVASGPNGASPHHDVSERVIGSGEPVVVDIGGTTADGYCSDSTRTYVLGAAPAAFAEQYAVLLAAQKAAVAAVRPGVPAESVDAAARDLIVTAGHGEAFLHRTGHGIGVQTHEDPYIVGGNTQPLEPGMAFSVEPGLYFAGQHGARIEDIVVVTEDGVERLNRTSRELGVL